MGQHDGMWTDLRGAWTYGTGTNGALTLPAGARVLSIQAQAAGAASVSIFGGAAIPLGTSGLSLRFNHTLVQAQSVKSRDIVFTGTTGYFVEYVK